MNEFSKESHTVNERMIVADSLGYIIMKCE